MKKTRASIPNGKLFDESFFVLGNRSKITDIYSRYAEREEGCIKVIPGQTSSGKTFAIQERIANILVEHIVQNGLEPDGSFVPLPVSRHRIFYVAPTQQLVEQFQDGAVDLTLDKLAEIGRIDKNSRSGYRKLVAGYIVWLRGNDDIWKDTSRLKDILERIGRDNRALAKEKDYKRVWSVFIEGKPLFDAESRDELKKNFRYRVCSLFGDDYCANSVRLYGKCSKDDDDRQRIRFMTESRRWSWIDEMYPASLLANRHIFLCTSAKMYYNASPVIYASLSIMFSDLLQGAEIYLDEANRVCEDFLTQIIEQCASVNCDLPVVFRSVVQRVSSVEFDDLWNRLRIDADYLLTPDGEVDPAREEKSPIRVPLRALP